jgi:hypothetical protein
VEVIHDLAQFERRTIVLCLLPASAEGRIFVHVWLVGELLIRLADTHIVGGILGLVIAVAFRVTGCLIRYTIRWAVDRLRRTEKMLETDVLIIGEGSAGQAAAVSARRGCSRDTALQRTSLINGNFNWLSHIRSS